jgi:hypothetical protein
MQHQEDTKEHSMQGKYSGLCPTDQAMQKAKSVCQYIPQKHISDHYRNIYERILKQRGEKCTKSSVLCSDDIIHKDALE